MVGGVVVPRGLPSCRPPNEKETNGGPRGGGVMDRGEPDNKDTEGPDDPFGFLDPCPPCDCGWLFAPCAVGVATLPEGGVEGTIGMVTVRETPSLPFSCSASNLSFSFSLSLAACTTDSGVTDCMCKGTFEEIVEKRLGTPNLGDPGPKGSFCC